MIFAITNATAATANPSPILPLNVRELFDLNEDLVCILSVAFNSLLAAIVLTEENKILKAYSRVLLQNVVCDFLFTVVSFITKAECEFSEGQLVALVGGIYDYLPVGWHYFGFGSYIMTLMMCMFVIPFVFYLQYCLLVRKVNLRERQLRKAIILIIIWSAIITATMLNYDSDRVDGCRQMLTHPIWTYGGRTIDNCILSRKMEPLMLMYFMFVGLSNGVAYTVMIYCTVTVFGALKKTRPNMHIKTAQLHSQMNTLLIVQLLMPTFCATVPLGMGTASFVLHMNQPGLAMLAMMAFAWIPLINPTVTIFFVSNYRIKCFSFVREPWRKVFKGHGIAQIAPTDTAIHSNTANNHT